MKHNKTHKQDILYLTVIAILFCLWCSYSIAFAENDDFLNYDVFEQANDPNSTTLVQFCEKVTIPVIHTKSYYKKARKEIEGQSTQKKALALLNGLSKISHKAMLQEYTLEESIEITKQLIRLEKKLLETKPIGSVNMALHNQVSIMASGMIFYIVSSCEKSDFYQLKPFEKSRYKESHIPKNELKRMISEESGIHFNKEHKFIQDLMIDAIKEKNMSVVNDYMRLSNKKEFRSEDIEALFGLAVWSNPLSIKSPLDEFQEISFAYNFMTARKVAFYARLSIEWRMIMEMDLTGRQKADKLKEIIREKITTSNSEWEYYPNNEDDLTQIVRDVLGNVKRYTNNKGLNLIEYANKQRAIWRSFE